MRLFTFMSLLGLAALTLAGCASTNRVAVLEEENRRLTTELASAREQALQAQEAQRECQRLRNGLAEYIAQASAEKLQYNIAAKALREVEKNMRNGTFNAERFAQQRRQSQNTRGDDGQYTDTGARNQGRRTVVSGTSVKRDSNTGRAANRSPNNRQNSCTQRGHYNRPYKMPGVSYGTRHGKHGTPKTASNPKAAVN